MSWREVSIIMSLTSIAFSLFALFYMYNSMNSARDRTWQLPVDLSSHKVLVRRRCRRTLDVQESKFLTYAMGRSKEFVAAPTFVRLDYSESMGGRTLVFCRDRVENYSSSYYEIIIPQGLLEDFGNGVYDVYDLQQNLTKIIKK